MLRELCSAGLKREIKKFSAGYAKKSDSVGSIYGEYI